jgi:hypothetical protein
MHPLHLAIGQFLYTLNLPQQTQLLLAPECGGSHNLPLFSSIQKGNDTEFCNVDALIIQNNTVSVIIEIEESGLIPTKICGKFLTTALSTHFIHNILNNQATNMASKVCFIQIIDSSKLPKGTSKLRQGNNIELSIQRILPVNNVCEYKLLYFQGAQEFSSQQLQNVIQQHLEK